MNPIQLLHEKTYKNTSCLKFFTQYGYYIQFCRNLDEIRNIFLTPEILQSSTQLTALNERISEFLENPRDIKSILKNIPKKILDSATNIITSEFLLFSIPYQCLLFIEEIYQHFAASQDKTLTNHVSTIAKAASLIVGKLQNSVADIFSIFFNLSRWFLDIYIPIPHKQQQENNPFHVKLSNLFHKLIKSTHFSESDFLLHPTLSTTIPDNFTFQTPITVLLYYFKSSIEMLSLCKSYYTEFHSILATQISSYPYSNPLNPLYSIYLDYPTSDFFGVLLHFGSHFKFVSVTLYHTFYRLLFDCIVYKSLYTLNFLESIYISSILSHLTQSATATAQPLHYTIPLSLFTIIQLFGTFQPNDSSPNLKFNVISSFLFEDGDFIFPQASILVSSTPTTSSSLIPYPKYENNVNFPHSFGPQASLPVTTTTSSNPTIYPKYEKNVDFRQLFGIFRNVTAKTLEKVTKLEYSPFPTTLSFHFFIDVILKALNPIWNIPLFSDGIPDKPIKSLFSIIETLVKLPLTTDGTASSSSTFLSRLTVDRCLCPVLTLELLEQLFYYHKSIKESRIASTYMNHVIQLSHTFLNDSQNFPLPQNHRSSMKPRISPVSSHDMLVCSYHKSLGSYWSSRRLFGKKMYSASKKKLISALSALPPDLEIKIPQQPQRYRYPALGATPPDMEIRYPQYYIYPKNPVQNIQSLLSIQVRTLFVLLLILLYKVELATVPDDVDETQKTNVNKVFLRIKRFTEREKSNGNHLFISKLSIFPTVPFSIPTHFIPDPRTETLQNSKYQGEPSLFFDAIYDTLAKNSTPVQLAAFVSNQTERNPKYYLEAADILAPWAKTYPFYHIFRIKCYEKYISVVIKENLFLERIDRMRSFYSFLDNFKDPLPKQQLIVQDLLDSHPTKSKSNLNPNLVPDLPHSIPHFDNSFQSFGIQVYIVTQALLYIDNDPLSNPLSPHNFSAIEPGNHLAQVTQSLLSKLVSQFYIPYIRDILWGSFWNKYVARLSFSFMDENIQFPTKTSFFSYWLGIYLELTEKLFPSGEKLTQAYFQASNYYHYECDTKKSMYFWSKGFDMLPTKSYPKARALHTLFLRLKRNSEFEKAETAISQSMAILTSLQSQTLGSNSNSNSTSITKQIQNFLSPPPVEYFLAIAQNDYAKFLYSRNRIIQAQKYAQSSFDEFERHPNLLFEPISKIQYRISQSLFILGKYSHKQRNHKKAKKLFIQGYFTLLQGTGTLEKDTFPLGYKKATNSTSPGTDSLERDMFPPTNSIGKQKFRENYLLTTTPYQRTLDENVIPDIERFQQISDGFIKNSNLICIVDRLDKDILPFLTELTKISCDSSIDAIKRKTCKDYLSTTAPYQQNLDERLFAETMTYGQSFQDCIIGLNPNFMDSFSDNTAFILKMLVEVLDFNLQFQKSREVYSKFLLPWIEKEKTNSIQDKDASKLDILFSIFLNYSKYLASLKDFAGAEKFMSNAINLYGIKTNPILYHSANFHLGLYLQRQEKYKKAEYFFKMALLVTVKQLPASAPFENEKWIIRTVIRIGTCILKQTHGLKRTRYGLALKIFSSPYQFIPSPTISDIESLVDKPEKERLICPQLISYWALLHEKIGTLYLDLKKYEKAAYFYRKTLVFLAPRWEEEELVQGNRARFYHNFALSKSKQGKFSVAEKLYIEAIKLHDLSGCSKDAESSRNNLDICHRRKLAAERTPRSNIMRLPVRHN